MCVCRFLFWRQCNNVACSMMENGGGKLCVPLIRVVPRPFAGTRRRVGGAPANKLHGAVITCACFFFSLSPTTTTATTSTSWKQPSTALSLYFFLFSEEITIFQFGNWPNGSRHLGVTRPSRFGLYLFLKSINSSVELCVDSDRLSTEMTATCFLFF